ncbi:MAG: hypothetical protein J6B85_11180 [Lachnospiraceae bacterium]|nr:hypothetical protein [Lachnospiraceae bacterium]
MNISRMIEKEMDKSGGRVRIVKVPASKRPTAESLKKLDREIAAQVSANEAMSNRSMLYASKMPLK